MKCDVCGKPDASTYVIRLTDGHDRGVNLCPSCAQPLVDLAEAGTRHRLRRRVVSLEEVEAARDKNEGQRR